MEMVPVVTQVHGNTEASKVVIDVDETETVERKQLASRSEYWQHFIKIKDDKGQVRAGKCRYCSREIKAGTREHGTSAMLLEIIEREWIEEFGGKGKNNEQPAVTDTTNSKSHTPSTGRTSTTARPTT